MVIRMAFMVLPAVVGSLLALRSARALRGHRVVVAAREALADGLRASGATPLERL